ncbi:MAG: TonB-dependent receptor, partial [Gammaproteobacteria bacterium]|nr:TonB-dependent receptor [Gammaproteobacteria bacterium]
IRGTSGDLDVRGSGQIVNVILTEAIASNSISYEASIDRYQDQNYRPGGTFSLSGQRGGLDYLFAARSQPRYNVSIGDEYSILGDFSMNDLVLETRTRDQMENEVSMNLGYEISDSSSLRINALYADRDDPTDVERYTTNLRVTPNSLLSEREEIPSQRDNWEIGGDYELNLGNGQRFKLLAIANQDNRDSARERFLLLDEGTEEKNLYLGINNVTEEQIVRGSFTTSLFDTQSIEFGIERAQTSLDSALTLGGIVENGTPSAAVGGLVPQAVSNANSSVEEIRYEPFAIHNWTLTPTLSLETTLLYESSEITQSGDSSNQRDFSFVKPKVDLRFNPSTNLQLRGSIEKIVNQLSFADFVAVNDETDNDTNTLEGNTDLRQQWQWRYVFNGEYRLPNDLGVLNAEVFYAQHEDVIDRLDSSRSEDSLQSVNGNIGDGVEIGVNLSASVRATPLGMPNLLVTTSLNVQDSEVTDPHLGVKRRFQNYQRGRFTLFFRHDIPDLRMNWGMQYFDRIDGGMFRYDVDDIEFNVGEPRVNLFAEYRNQRGTTYRFDAGALTNGSQCRRRTRFIGRTTADILEEIEYRCTTTGIELSLRVNGTF